MRQYGEVPPWLAAANYPALSVISGLGTGGGASLVGPLPQGFGDVLLIGGAAAPAGGSVKLTFAAPPPTLFTTGDEALGVITAVVAGPAVTLSWTGTLRQGRRHLLHYEWNVSR